MMRTIEQEFERQMDQELSTWLTNQHRTGVDRILFVWVEHESLQRPGQYCGSFRSVTLRECQEHPHTILNVNGGMGLRFLNRVYNEHTYRYQPRA